ncbi:MAG: nitrile hydratase subunit beta [Paracoccaceae bacterium]
MSRLHDMGGRFGDGPVVPEPADAPVFAEEWHARALAVTLAAGSLGLWTLDASRHSRECLLPADYAVFSYYEKWISALCNMLVEHDVLSRAELQSATAESKPSPLQARRLTPDKVAKVLSSGGPTERESDKKPRFAIGDAVRAGSGQNQMINGGHSRLPSYVAGKNGRIVQSYGAHVFPDANAHGQGEAPEPLYCVAFRADVLWAHAENPDDEVMLDLWQSYLDPM